MNVVILVNPRNRHFKAYNHGAFYHPYIKALTNRGVQLILQINSFCLLLR